MLNYFLKVQFASEHFAESATSHRSEATVGTWKGNNKAFEIEKSGIWCLKKDLI